MPGLWHHLYGQLRGNFCFIAAALLGVAFVLMTSEESSGSVSQKTESVLLEPALPTIGPPPTQTSVPDIKRVSEFKIESKVFSRTKPVTEPPKPPSCFNWLPQNRFGRMHGIQESRYATLQSVLRPSPCLVKGFAMEELDPEENFRRGYTFGHALSWEDKSHILPYLLGARDPSLHERKRRIFLDLGGKSFNLGVLWMIRNYPLDFTEYHVFDVNGELYEAPIPPKQSIFADPLHEISSFSRRRASLDPPPVINSMLNGLTVHSAFVSDEDGKMTLHNKEKLKVNITRFIKEELKATSDDTLIVKMDIEGTEYPILRAWVDDLEMAKIVDELFVELHNNHPSMAEYGWDKFSETRKDAVKVLLDLRKSNYYAHSWP